MIKSILFWLKGYPIEHETRWLKPVRRIKGDILDGKALG